VSRDPAQLQRLAAERQVGIANVPFAELLMAHLESRSSGALRARRGPVDKRVVLERGVPVDCRSNLLHETLSRYLVSIGRIDEASANTCLAESAWRGAQIGEILIQKGLLDAHELTRILQQNLAKKLLDLFTWPDGEVAIEDGAPASSSSLRIRVPQLVLTGVTRFMPQAAVERALEPLAGARLVRNPHRTALLAELRLAPAETALIEVLARPRRVEELAREAGPEAAARARSLYALLVLGLAASEEQLPAWASHPPPPPNAPGVAPAPAPEAPAPGPASSLVAAGSPPAAQRLAREQVTTLLNRVSHLFLDHRQKDAFDLLEVGEESATSEVEERYLAFARELAPARFEEPGLRMVADYARELFLAGARAYGELADPERRSELRVRRQVRREERERTARPSYHRIDTDLLDPALQFRKGMALLEAGKLKAALQQLEFAADCDPQNGAYRAEVARCRFRLLPGSAGRQAIEELEEAQRIDPKSVEPLLYHGEIATGLGLFDAAEASLRKAARLLGPEDRRALDALRDLTAARKKKR
jgi:tetratricopeptide (TPR) repeat protein